ncbi:cytochrome P450 81Q32-like [Actinidia eriantha]|uniref:cytochrome P450 81Q32-like n=1 Tax=Actinidia eriantha TaxID=165200 RepID=UPI0025862C7F|nr:cytochrome P450 81Q32-like [Actinidia eriantha]
MDSTCFYFLSLATSLSLLLLLLKLLNNQTPPKNPPPSPPALPIIGHLHLLKEPFHRALQCLSASYGPILALRFGSRSVLVVSSPSTLEECLSKNDVLFANRPHLLVGKHLFYNYTTLGTASYGHQWRTLRRFSTLEIFSTAKLNAFLSIRREEVKSLLNNLNHENFSKVNLKSRLSEYSFNIIMRMISGKRYFGAEAEGSEEAGRFRGIISEIFELSGSSNPADYVPFLKRIGFGEMERRMLKIQKVADEFLQGLIDDIRNNNKDPNGEGRRNKSMIHSMLDLQGSEPELYSDQAIKGNILTMLLAGTDTSAVTIEWAMSLLLNHPEVLKRARAELDDIIRADRLADEPDLSKLPYLQNIINETLRLFPPAPLLIAHESSDNCTIGGFDVARGTMLLPNVWAIHRDPKVWEDPTSFKPERFKNRDGEAYKFIPFGIGRRSCPGAGLANRVVGLALAGLIQCFEWERVSEELVDMTEGQGLTMPKVKPLEAMCKAREKMIRVLSEL